MNVVAFVAFVVLVGTRDLECIARRRAAPRRRQQRLSDMT